MANNDPYESVEDWARWSGSPWIKAERVESLVARLPTAQLLKDYAAAVRAPDPPQNEGYYSNPHHVETEDERWQTALPLLCDEIGQRIDSLRSKPNPDQ